MKGDHPLVVELLLDGGIEVNKSSPEHGSALRCACDQGNKRMIQSLLDHGASVNADNDNVESILTQILSYKEDLSRARISSQVPVQRYDVVEMLLSHEPKAWITERGLLAAVSADFAYGRTRPRFTSLLFRHDESAIATETVIVRAISEANRYDTENGTLALLLKHDGGLGTTPAMLKVAQNGSMVRLLLGHTPVCRLTADVVINSLKLRDEWERPEMIDVFFEYGMTVEFATEIMDVLNGKPARRKPVAGSQSRNDNDTRELFFKLGNLHG